MGHKPTLQGASRMSALPSKADMHKRPLSAKNRFHPAVATRTLYLHCSSILVEARAMATAVGSVPGALNSERSVAV
jgi:hypothetical protein